MVSLRVEKAFCCASLRTGNLILGWMGTISWIVFLMVCIILLALNGEKISEEKEFLDVPGVPTEIEKREDRSATLILVMLLCVLHASVSIAHLYGTYKYRKSYLKPNLIFGAIQLGILILSTAYGLITANVDKVCSGVLLFAIAFYFYLILWSFYKEIDEGHAPVEHGQASMELQ